MRRVCVCLALAVLALYAVPLFAQSNLTEEEVERATEGIRERYALIQKDLDSYDAELKEYTSMAGFGEVKTYSDNGSIRKVRDDFLADAGEHVREVFYWDDEVFFVFSRLEQYQIEPAQPKTEVRQDRYYYYEGELIRWLVTITYEASRGQEDYAYTEETVMGNANMLLRFARSPYDDLDVFFENQPSDSQSGH